MSLRKGSLSHNILEAMGKMAVEIPELLSYSAQMRYLRELSELTHVNRRYFSKSIRRFQERGLVEFEENREGELSLRLTALGKEIVGLSEEWDGKYRVVIWDIPESKRRFRDILRRKLKEWKFVSLQKSVWVSKRNATGQLRKLVLELEMEKWVTVIESEDPVLGDIKFHDRGI